MSPKPLVSLSLYKLTHQPELFARKVVVLAYYLKPLDDGSFCPEFLFTVIAPKQKHASQSVWKRATKFRLPSGYSLIKGTREMMYAGQRLDVPRGFGRYFDPQRWNEELLNNAKHHKLIAKIDGVMPAVSTALTEAREEGGLRNKHIQQIIDMGVINFRLDGRQGAYHCLAFELKSKKHKKAIDSLAISHFNYQEMKRASKTRLRYNVPLIRPSHSKLIKKLRPELTDFYQSQNRVLNFHYHDAEQWKQRKLKLIHKFKKLFNEAALGKFVCLGYDEASSRQSIIQRSQRSKTKKKRLIKTLP